jgi:hypothetical protein
MANLLSNTTIGGYQSIHTGNIGSYAITSIPTSFSSITVTSSFDTASNDIYASMRVIRNNASSADGMYIGYGNSGSGITRIFGGGSTGGALEKYATYTYEPGSFRAPIFYDANDTTYYFNGDSTTSLRTLGSWRADSADWDGEYSGKIQYHSNHWYFQSGNLWIFRNAGGGNVFQVDQSGNGTFSSDIYLGVRGTWLSSYLNQDVRTTASPSFSTVNLNTLNASDTNARYYVQSTNGVPSNNLGNPTVTEMALFDEQFNNKTAFYDNTALSFWTSSDGTNYTEYTGFDTTTKKRFLGGDSDSGVVIPNQTNRFRIELENTAGYVFLNQLYIYWSSNSHSTKVHIWVRRCDNNQWYQHTDSNTQVSSWPGHLYLPFSTIPFYPGALASTGHFNKIRIEFIPTWSTGDYSTYPINLMRMQIWGGYPAGKRNIYSVDENQNVSFPAILSATTFSGALSGNATTASALTSMNISQFTNNSGYITGYTETDTLASVTGRGATTASQVSFTQTGDHAISVGTIRGRAVGVQSGEFIQLYERVNIGGPNGWGASNTSAPSYGLSVYGGATIGYGNSAGLAVTGRITVQNGNDSGTLYGPNATWSAYLYVGAASNNVASTTAQVISTDGNLHIDSGSGSKQIYMNYYSGMVTGIYGGLNMQNTYITNASYIRSNTNIYTDQNYGYGLVGVYSASRYQGVFAMGDSYKLTADGTGTGTLYGIAWTHTNVGGQSKSGLGHQALFMDNGVTQTAIGSGIWTAGLITTTSYGTSANWKSAYDWGNHASAGYLTGITSGQVTGALGYTPYNSSNPNGYITGYTETNTFLGDGGAADTHPGTSRLIFTGQVSSGADTLGMPANDNSNAFLNINRHPGEYNSQLGFSSNGSMYYRSFSATAINNSQAWRQVWDSGNLTNLNQLTNGPGYITSSALSGYATQSYVNSQGFLTSLPSHNHDDRYYTETESDGRYAYKAGAAGQDFSVDKLSSYYLRNHYGVSTNHSYGMYFDNDLSTAYGIFRESGAWDHPYPDLRIAFHTGIKLGANSSYQGIRFYTDYDMTTQVMSVNNGSDPLGAGNVYVNNSLQAGSSLRAPIFYDSQNTDYYVDPNSTSRINSTIIYGGTSGTSPRLTFMTTDDGDTNKYIGMVSYWTQIGCHVNEGLRLINSNGVEQFYVRGGTSGNEAWFRGNVTASGILYASGGNSSNWNTAYSWGNHASAGYLTSLPSHTHDDRYYTESESDSRYLSINGGTVTGWALFTASTQGTAIVRATQQDTSAGYYLFQGITGSSEVFRVERSGRLNSAEYIYSYGYRGNGNVGGTGSASWHPDGIYCGSTMWQYGAQYKNNTGIYDVSEFKLNAGPTLSIYNSRNLSVRALDNNADVGILGQKSGGGFAFQIYGTGSSYGFLNGIWAAWDIRKAVNGAMYMNDNDSYYLQTNSTSNFVALNIQGNAVVHAGNIGSQSVSYATTAGTANAVAWTNVSSRPTALSQFTNDLGNYGGFLTSITAHSHAISDVSGLQTALDGKQASGSYLTTSGKAADSELIDGIDSFRIVYGDGDKKSTNFSDMNAYNQSSGFFFYNQPTGNPFSDWTNWINVMGNSWNNNYGFQIAHAFHSDGFAVRRVTNGSFASWRTIIDSGNIGSQSVSYASSAGSVAWTNVSSRPTALSQFSNDLGNYGGWITSSGSISGSAGSVTGLTLTSSANGINPDSVTQNQIGYNTSVSLFGQTDGGLYSSAYSSSWIHQIYGDFRTGQIAIRGKNSGSWQAWRTVLDSSNYTSYAPGLTGSGASGTWGISVTGNAATVGGYAVSGSVGANTVVIRDANNYIYAHYINSNVSESENPTINSFYTSNGDGWLRKSSVAHVKSQLGLGSMAYESSGTYQTVSGAINTGNIGSQSVSYATTSQQLTKFGDIYGQDWNSYYINGKMIVSSVYGGSGPNFPTGAYNYGAMLSYGVTGSDFFQVYFPENGALQGGAFRKLHYRTGWNGSWSAWKSVVDQEGQVCTIAGSNQTGIEIHSNVGYNQDPLTYFLMRGQADNSWKAFKVRLTGDAGGQDIEFRRIAENGADARMWYVPRGANTVNFDYPIVQPSDSRLKDNITPISTPVDKIKSLRGVEFDWNSGEQVGTHDVGLIAQDVEAVLPEAVTTQEDGYKNLAYAKVIPLLVEAMKEQQAMIEALKAEIELLKNK